MIETAPRSDRPFDVVLWGATGYTGRLVAEYLAGKYPPGSLRWALGGRSRSKLEALRSELARLDARAGELSIVLGDNADRASLDRLARQTRVVCTTVGPYAVHGRELVAACVDAGTDYCDLTGETPFLRETIDLHHERAKNETGARIVPTCGFDSVPSDLGTLLVQEHARRVYGARCAEVKCFVTDATGGISGGTAASAVTILGQAAADRQVRRLLADPYALDPEANGDRGGEQGDRPAQPDQWGVRWDDDAGDAGGWTGPFPMAGVNTRVVRRSNAVLGYPWGRDFRYHEAMSFSAGPRGWLAAAGVSAGVAAFVGAMAVPPLRALVAKTVLPAPGEGPSKETRDRGHFALKFVGVLEARNGAPAKRVRATVSGTGDPGYGETAKMLAESAVCLALDGDAVAKEGGVLTPASCMGMRLVERLRSAGITFAIDA